IIFVSLIWVLSEIALARLKHSDTAGTKQDKSSLRILWSTIILGITAGYFLAMYRVGTIPAVSYYAAISGLALIVVGLVVRWIAILTLWKYFTVDVSIANEHKLVNKGLYKLVRHPAYTGSLLSFLGVGMVFSSWLALLVIFVPITIAFVYRIKVEEKALTAFFGDQYARYCATTKRLIPMIY
ncbi:MAG: isoprenylcysteine carboxylmethyltransferase family protein, partial [candidate division Zixibacteria bacterium]|nr:isoprenylcysteine carboxylmethyltransferase family protein [candidate division Zixibacteria bacterium]